MKTIKVVAAVIRDEDRIFATISFRMKFDKRY